MLLFWDIDGTLLTTGRAGIYAWEDALHDVTGVCADLETFDTAGHPDFGIARRLLAEIAGTEATAERVMALVASYEARLPGALPRRTGRVLPNVREILDRLAAEPGIRSLLLTGNTRAGAAAKLAHYGLSHHFDGGGFSQDDGDRPAIARAALALAEARYGRFAPERVFVIGDTPHDVRCGQTIGARTVAVATGAHDLAALAAAGPWRLVPELPPPAAFLDLLHGRFASADA